MLFKEAVESRVLELLRELQARQYLQGFSLAGGTPIPEHSPKGIVVDEQSAPLPAGAIVLSPEDRLVH